MLFSSSTPVISTALWLKRPNLGIPVIAVVDTNNSPEGVKHVIPGNDDSAKAIRLYCRGIADAVLEGKTKLWPKP